MKKLLSTILAFITIFSSTAYAAENDSVYIDVSPDYLYASAIHSITEQGVVQGYEDGTYKPERTLTRSELLKIALESFGENYIEQFQSENCFPDVTDEDWANKYICFAKEQGYVHGYGDGTFGPKDPVNLVEALKIIMEVYELESYDLFLDESISDDWYKPIIDFSTETEFIPSDFTRIDQDVNRGQMAEIIVRVQNFDPLEKITPSLKPEIFDPLSSELANLPETKQLNVPFSAQAPYQKWIVPYDEACEETSMIMIDYYHNGKTLTTDTADSEILSLTKWVADQGYAIDVGSFDMQAIVTEYYGKTVKTYTKDDVTIENIKALITMGYPIIVPFAGQNVGNKNYIYPGPPYHVLVLTGYDEENFYTNDPGTQFGYNYAYDQQIFFDAIHDWAGSKDNVLDGQKAILVIEDEKVL